MSRVKRLWRWYTGRPRTHRPLTIHAFGQANEFANALAGAASAIIGAIIATSLGLHGNQVLIFAGAVFIPVTAGTILVRRARPNAYEIDTPEPGPLPLPEPAHAVDGRWGSVEQRLTEAQARYAHAVRQITDGPTRDELVGTTGALGAAVRRARRTIEIGRAAPSMEHGLGAQCRAEVFSIIAGIDGLTDAAGGLALRQHASQGAPALAAARERLEAINAGLDALPSGR